MRIRNFSIIAHIDHGKTTLTDSLLRITGAIGSNAPERLLDSNPIERERGITIKLAPVTFAYTPQDESESYTFNLIDTPGHVDFGYEVSRSLAACEGVVLVVDATQGLQAQTLSHYHQATKLGLPIIPVINKIDLPSADVEKTTLELMELTGQPEEQILAVSAKSRLHCADILEAVITRIPPPQVVSTTMSRGLLISSHYDVHRGAIALVRVVDGSFAAGKKIAMVGTGCTFTPAEVGIFVPGMQPLAQLEAGQVGYIVTSLKDVRGLQVGDTMTLDASRQSVQPLLGYKPPTPMVYLELYPFDAGDFTDVKEAMEKLVLRDAALQYVPAYSSALGSGFRVGFLGILHAEVVLERLKREFNLELIATSPSVSYQVHKTAGEVVEVSSPHQLPDESQIAEIREPLIRVQIITPAQYQHVCLDLLRLRRGSCNESRPFAGQVLLDGIMPLAELITDFHDLLKSASSGFASLDYEYLEHRRADIVLVTILINQEPVEALSFMTVRNQAERRGRALVEKLKDILPRQMFEVAIQAAIGGKIIARETLRAYRKDVTAKLYGGDVTRRKKLLAKQAKGKKRMRQFGSVELTQDTFLQLLKRS